MRTVLLCHDKLGPLEAKTATCILRYSTRHDVVAVLDASKAGTDAADSVPSVRRGVPVVASLEDALAFEPEALVIGIAPMGGRLPDAWRPEIRLALERGLRVESGLHTFLADDAEFAALAKRTGATLWDVRRPVKDPRIATGEGAEVDSLVVHTMGTDCSSGKMTVAVELDRAAKRRGVRSAFAATGQTGIMIGADAGAPVDRLVSDFVAGAAEELVLECAGQGADLVFVEGQGSLDHYAYSGVTLGLMHGCHPDLVVLCHQAGRTGKGERKDGGEHPIQSLDWHRAMIERLSAPVHPTRVAAVALATFHLNDEDARRAVRDVEEATGLPCDDPVRYGADRLLDAVLGAGRDTRKRAAQRLAARRVAA